MIFCRQYSLCVVELSCFCWELYRRAIWPRKKKSVLSLNNWITLVLSTFYTSISSIPDMFWDSHFAIKFGILPCPNYSNKLFLEFSKPWRFLHAKEMSSDEGAVGGNTPNSLLHTIVELKMAMSFQIAVNIQSSVKIVIFFFCTWREWKWHLRGKRWERRWVFCLIFKKTIFFWGDDDQLICMCVKKKDKNTEWV